MPSHFFRFRKMWSSHSDYQLFILYCTLFVFHVPCLRAQSPTRAQLTGTWIGVHTEWDTDAFCPLPAYLQLEADSTYHLGMVDGSAAELTSTWAIEGARVRLDTIHYAPRLVRVANDLLRIGTRYPLVFRRFSAIPVDSANAYRQLSGRVWQSDSLIVSLYASGRVSLENLVTKQRTVHFWQLTQFNTSVFLLIQGNPYKRDSNFKAFWQISQLVPKQLQIIGWNGHSVATETFRLVNTLAPGDSCRPAGFQTCGNCFNRMWYTSTVSGSEERYTLKRLFAQHYHLDQKPGQSGLITLTFVVNCAGERGGFELTGFDDSYCRKDFDPQITQQLLTICRTYVNKDLSALVTDLPGLTAEDSFISLTFRLKDGQLVDILQ